jgi:hypothetical protein
MAGPSYLDYCAIRPLDAVVVDATEHYLSDLFGNPSSDRIYGYRTSGAVRAFGKQLAALRLSPGCATRDRRSDWRPRRYPTLSTISSKGHSGPIDIDGMTRNSASKIEREYAGGGEDRWAQTVRYKCGKEAVRYPASYNSATHLTELILPARKHFIVNSRNLTCDAADVKKRGRAIPAVGP